ncbi:hypothetical protein BKA93DRAFT_182203 [Sparassis latifolia]
MDSRRPSLTASYSFSGPSVAESSSRSLKRRLTTSGTEPAYFHPASTFRPKPYQFDAPDPSTLSAAPAEPPNLPPGIASTSRNPTTRHTSSRNHHLSYNPSLTMDPSPTDPGAVFIRPPFTSFPDAHKYKDGLTYNLMAANPEWFLDPKDFISYIHSDPAAICYPSQLEPPRGWCPTKKKDVKDKWPGGEEQPKLRCTFCRRTYAGVNAKSMWRRHVYEKHKIAMSNRRDTAERKGRGSNKENKDREASQPSSANNSGTANMEEGPSMDRIDAADCNVAIQPSGQYPRLLQDEVLEPDGNVDLFRSVTVNTPPLTPGFSPSKSASRRRLNFTYIAESPYDPLVTPSFRHSPARLPSDQPWRFPSPSHPLHSARDLSLCMLARGEASPTVSGLDVSPVVIVPASERGKRSIFSSPFALSDGADKGPFSEFDDKLRFTTGSTPRRLFYDGPLPAPMSDRSKFKEYRIAESPLRRTMSSRKDVSMGSAMTASSSCRDMSLSPVPKSASGTGLLAPIQLQGEDPFADSLYESWVDLTGSGGEGSAGESGGEGSAGESGGEGSAGESGGELSPPPSPEEENMTLMSTQPGSARSRQVSSYSSGSGSSSSAKGKATALAGLGMGLMDAVLSSRSRSSSGKHKRKSHRNEDHDIATMSRPEREETAPVSPIQWGRKAGRDLLADWLRDDDSDSEIREAHQSKKRRKTLSGRT